MAIDNIAQEICTGCGICIAICPQDVLRVDESTKKAVIKYPHDCVACWACEVFCPVDCIEVSLPRSREIPSTWLGVEVRGGKQ